MNLRSIIKLKRRRQLEYSFTDFLGNIGVALIILSYLLLQLEKISSLDISYSIMNLIGASLVIVSLIENFNISALIIEVFWVAISLVGIFRNLIREK